MCCPSQFDGFAPYEMSFFVAAVTSENSPMPTTTYGLKNIDFNLLHFAPYDLY